MTDFSGEHFQLCGAITTPSAFQNNSFEIIGAFSGEAASWTFVRTATLESFAAFGTSTEAREDFDAEWRLPGAAPPAGFAVQSNEASKFSFSETFGVDLTPAEFHGLNRDDFEFGWQNDVGFLNNFDSLSSETEQFDGFVYVDTSTNGPYALSVGGVLTIQTNVGGPTSSTAIAATQAARNGAGGTFPTGFVGGEQISITVDAGSATTITFLAADQSAAQVVSRINTVLGYTAATESGGQINLVGQIFGTSGKLTLANITAGILAIIGHTAGTSNGTGNVANLAAVTADEIRTIVNGTAGLSAINAEAHVVAGSRVRIANKNTGSSVTIRVNTTAMATTIGLSPLDTTKTASGFASQNYEDLEEEWNYIGTSPSSGGHELSKNGFEDFVDSTSTATSWTVTANSNDKITIDLSKGGGGSGTGTIVAGTYSTVAALAAAVQTAVNSAIGAGLVTSTTSPLGKLRLKTVATERFRLRPPSSATAWTLLGFTAYDPTFQEWGFRYLETEVLTPSSFDSGTPEEVEDFEEQWRSNESSLFSFVDGTHLTAALFDVALQNVEDFENEWTLTL